MILGRNCVWTWRIGFGYVEVDICVCRMQLFLACHCAVSTAFNFWACLHCYKKWFLALLCLAIYLCRTTSLFSFVIPVVFMYIKRRKKGPSKTQSSPKGPHSHHPLDSPRTNPQPEPGPRSHTQARKPLPS
jgi:hypothetical protein